MEQTETELKDTIEDVELEIENIPTEDNNIEILGTEQEFSLVMYLDKDVDTKYFNKFIKATERAIRSNPDYKLYLKALRELPELSRDAFLRNLSSHEVEIQLHHYPFNLYSIVRIVAEKMLMEDKRVSSFIIADEVIKLHMDDQVGLVPLTVTTHELAHLGKLEFLRTQIYGNWERFYNEYKDYMDEYEHNLVKGLVERKCLPISDEDIKLITNSIEDVDIEKGETDLTEFLEIGEGDKVTDEMLEEIDDFNEDED